MNLLQDVKVTNPIVEISNAYKKYGSYEVLKGLSMSVQAGTIYSLLGPSGCGKTTVLSSILGRLKLDSGLIKLGIKSKSDIGYMPQELSLLDDLTILEMLQFFGRLYGLNSETVKGKVVSMTKLLHLPKSSSIIGTLSGGQARRVSFAVALLHDPKLFILDEPTVGLDPLLAQSIWDHFILETRDFNKTVIITTHYIEEATRSSTVALMRNGVILIQQSPAMLMSTLKCDQLEQVFLKLSEYQEKSEKYESSSRKQPSGKSSRNQPNFNEKIFHWNRCLAVLSKDVSWIRRNWSMVGFIIVLPVVLTCLLAVAIGSYSKDYTIGIVSGELDASKGLEQCNEMQNFTRHTYHIQCFLTKLITCSYVHQLQTRMGVVMRRNLNEARLSVHKGETWAFISISGNYTNLFLDRVDAGGRVNDELFKQTTMDVHMDMSDYVVSYHLKKNIIEAFVETANTVLDNCRVSTDLIKNPVYFHDPVYGKGGSTGTDALPGIVLSNSFLIAMSYTSGAFLTDKKSGFIERAAIAGVTWADILGAHYIVQSFLMAFQTAELLIPTYAIMDTPMIGSWALLVTITIAVEIMGSFYGYMLVEILDSERIVTYAAVGLSQCLNIVGGVLWPLEGAHAFVRNTAWMIPMVPCVDAFRAVATKGYPITNPTVYLGLLSAVIWTSIFGLVITLKKWRTSN